ncbi:MAG TPA: PAS domain S-box protein [Candidatus Dormibacteraeota bacterium]|nr:PAS domain S-box protein [Candidatus Dormibacteraeota bacterium]
MTTEKTEPPKALLQAKSPPSVDALLEELSRLEATLEQEREANRDLRQRTQNLQQRQMDTERLAAVVQFSDDAIITKDLNGIITSWNNGAQRVFGYTAEEALGKPVLMLMPTDRQNEEPGILDRIRHGERIDHYETVRQRKDGTLLNISLTVSPLRDAQGKIIGASKIARDITELFKARQALAQSHEELERRVAERTASLTEAIAQMEEFSYSVSHDLRAPIRAMAGYADAVLEDCADKLDDQAREYLKQIIRSGARMDRLILDILKYSKLARAEIVLQPLSLSVLVTDIVRQYPQMQPPHAKITIQDQMPEVLAYEPSLTQAISNLLSNAVKFVAPGVTPEVRIYSERRDNRVRLSVEDNGIGIKPEHQARLFGLFQRIHPLEVYDGTGIGLAIVRKAVERMGGKVGLQSNGRGSIFWVELAAAK